MRVVGDLAREVREVARAGTPTHGQLRDRLAGVAFFTLGVDLICAALALAFEHGAKATQISSFGSALFWTSTQLLTVSSSIQNPISTAGRVLDVAMEAYAITVVATLAGSIGAFMVKRARELEQAAERGGGA
jgi:predicted RNA methylase